MESLVEVCHEACYLPGVVGAASGQCQASFHREEIFELHQVQEVRDLHRMAVFKGQLEVGAGGIEAGNFLGLKQNRGVLGRDAASEVEVCGFPMAVWTIEGLPIVVGRFDDVIRQGEPGGRSVRRIVDGGLAESLQGDGTEIFGKAPDGGSWVPLQVSEFYENIADVEAGTTPSPPNTRFRKPSRKPTRRPSG